MEDTVGTHSNDPSSTRFTSSIDFRQEIDHHLLLRYTQEGGGHTADLKALELIWFLQTIEHELQITSTMRGATSGEFDRTFKPRMKAT